ncbi:MAG: prepilin-type N-terminal cleavage/methylation domain-containing protein [Planctomycetota bacterium]
MSKRSRFPSAFTLVELLVALTIATVLTVIALPTLKDSLRQNALSRSATLVKGAFINARSQAIRTGRPFGVVIERKRRDLGSGLASGLDFLTTNYSTRMYYVQSPLEYRGDVNSAAAIPVIVNTRQNTNSHGPFVPMFFMPRSSCGMSYAAASGNTSVARRLLDRGTRFSVNGSDYVFEVTNMTQTTLPSGDVFGDSGITQSGTLVEFDYATSAPRFDILPGVEDSTPAITTALPGDAVAPLGLFVGQRYPFRFQTNPIRAPLAPVTLVGKTVVDLSISGTGAQPLLFNTQAMLDSDPTSAILPLAADQSVRDIVVMFAPDGRLDGVYHAVATPNGTGTAIAGFTPFRLDPASTVSFNVGFVDGILDNIDDGARYPNAIPDTNFAVNNDDPPLAAPYDAAPPTGPVASPVVLNPDKVPNYANSDCAWVSVQPLSGSIQLDTVASQPTENGLADFISYYGLGTSFTVPSVLARNVIGARVRYSRRLVSSGATP